MSGSWGCPHEVDDTCTKINNLPCDPGMKGCVLAGRYVFANQSKNGRLHEKQVSANAAADQRSSLAAEDGSEPAG